MIVNLKNVMMLATNHMTSINVVMNTIHKYYILLI